MWNRKELKANAKVAFKRNYWRCVLAALIITLVLGSAAGSTSRKSPDEENSGSTTQVTVSVGTVSTATLLGIFVFAPLEIGSKKFFAHNTVENAPISDIGAGFSSKYGRNILSMFLTDLFIALWTLLFIIPGIVKVYSYKLVPYILADHPELSATEAITLSRRMMNGNKWNAFVLDLSFIGWIILTILTAGILGVFYVDPYMQASYGELYRALCAEAE